MRQTITTKAARIRRLLAEDAPEKAIPLLLELVEAFPESDLERRAIVSAADLKRVTGMYHSGAESFAVLHHHRREVIDEL